MALEFKLPDIGEGIAEGEITRWHVEEGQSVGEDAPLVEVMTDKATVEISSPAAGVVSKIHYPVGATVPVGDVIVVIETDGAVAAATPVAAASAAQPVEAPAEPVAAAAPAAAAPAVALAPAPATTAPARSGRVLAAPAVRRRARERGIDLRQVPGSGPAGRVTRQDLEQFVAPPTAPAAAPVAAAALPSGGEERIPLRGIRKRIAERMARSKQTAAHFTYVDEVDVTELVRLRASLKEAAAAHGVKLTYMPFLVKAVTTALAHFPMLNATLDEEQQEIVHKHYYHVGFATDTEQGLVVPVIKDADRCSLLELSATIVDLADRGRAGKLTLDEVTGSTFTITNAGNIGGILATPVINYPEVAILGVHKIQDQAVVRDGEIVIRKMMNLSISLDHRVVDGADGARFLNEVIRLLETPGLMLLGAR